VQINNLPLEIGLTEKDVTEVVNTYMKRNYLSDPGNFYPVVGCTLNVGAKAATLELSSIEEARRMSKIEKIRVFDHDCRIVLLSESNYSGTTNMASLVA